MKPRYTILLPTTLLLAGLLLPSLRLAADPGLADVSPAQPSIPDKTFNIKDFGAIADGKTSNSNAFKAAIAALKAAGGGTLVVPAGVYFTGPIDLTSNCNLRVEQGATLLFSPVFTEYGLDGKKYRPLIYTKKAHDVEISGQGTLNGNGEAWWTEARRFKAEARSRHSSADTSPRPRFVLFDRCQRVRVEGITITNAPVFNLVPVGCEDVTVEGVTIRNPWNSPNTDGIDPSVSQRVLISHCTIDTGDDNIAVKAGGKDAPVMSDLLITDCTFLHGHGCSVGSETFSGLSNMTVRRCTFDGTDTGVRFKSDRKRGGLVENILYTDLTMKNVGHAISITSYYMGTTTDAGGTKDKVYPVTDKTPHWKGITVRNLTAQAGEDSRDAGLIQGLPEMPAEAITLDNVRISAPAGLQISNAQGVILRGVVIKVDSGPSVRSDDSVKGLQILDK